MIQQMIKPIPPESTSSGITERDPPRILLVDDQPARLVTYESILDGIGVQCVHCLPREDAVARLLDASFALILIDMSLSEKDGLETARLIRQHPRLEQTPIICVTAVHVTALDIPGGYEAGAIDYISVPIVPAILRGKVALLVELHRRRGELESLTRELSEVRRQLEIQRDRTSVSAGAPREREWLEAVFEGISDEVYFTDAEGRYTYANAAALREFGNATVLGLTVGELATRLGVLRPDGSPRPIEEAAPLRALRGEIVRNEEQIVRAPRTGDFRYRQISSAPVRDTQGKIIGAVSIGRDVTDIEQLRSIERERAQLLDISSEAIFVWQLDGVIQYWNKGAAELYGFSRTEAVGRVSHELLSTLHPDGIYEVVEKLRHTGSWHGELSHRTRSGTAITVQSAMQVVLRGRQALVMESNRDLTERKRIEDMLVEADRRKDQFLAILSHELRNPLAPIRNVAELLNSPNAGNDRLDWGRRVLHRQVAHMSRLLDDLLDITHITRGRLTIKKQPVPLSEVVKAAIDTVQPVMSEKAHHLTVDLPDDIPMIDGDLVRLAQVLSNLLVNSAKYTDRGGLIELRARVEGSMICLCVKDNGIGIPPEEIPQLFSMFSQLENARERSEGGLGIGLALARGIVELHHGTIDGKSAGPGTGSEFQVRLPLLESNPASTVASNDSASSDRLANVRIVIADDNRDAADSLGMLLSLDGDEVRVTHDGRSALSLSDTFRPHIVLLDIGMADLDGYEVARALRAQSWGTDMCLIALTGRGRPEDEQQAIKAGFNFHLCKPYEFTKLQELIAAHRTASAARRLLDTAT
jgi:PAS domain S-box-containing protein